MGGEALIVMDMQVGMLTGSDPCLEADQLVERIAALISRARSRNVPVVFVQHCDDPDTVLEEGSPGWYIDERVSPRRGEVVVQKFFPDAFAKTELIPVLSGLGAEHLIICGLQTEICVDTTCRRAFSEGYEVALVSDGHSTWNNGILSAEQIIAHHNRTLSLWAVKLARADDLFRV